jgi:hypothetical protein
MNKYTWSYKFGFYFNSVAWKNAMSTQNAEFRISSSSLIVQAGR